MAVELATRAEIKTILQRKAAAGERPTIVSFDRVPKGRRRLIAGVEASSAAHDVPIVFNLPRPGLPDTKSFPIAPSLVISGHGTEIWIPTTDGRFEKDQAHEESLSRQEVSWIEDGGAWSVVKDRLVENIAGDWKQQPSTRSRLRRKASRENQFMVHFSIPNSAQPNAIADFAEELAGKYTGIRAIVESDSKTGKTNLIIVPAIAGNNTLASVAEKCAAKIGQPIHVASFSHPTVELVSNRQQTENVTWQEYSLGTQDQPTVHEILRRQATTEAVLFPIEDNASQAFLDFMELTNPPRGDRAHAGQTNIIRRLEPYYGPYLDRRHRRKYPEDVTPEDITRHGLRLVKQAADEIFKSSIESRGSIDPKNRRKNMRDVWRGFYFDVLDGIRARLTGQANKEGAVLDLAADRTQEIYLILLISILNLKNSGPTLEDAWDTLTNSLLTATATVLPTISKAQDSILGVNVPEKSPNGGSRIDRILKATSALSRSVRSRQVDASTAKLEKMQSSVQGAFEYRSTPTELFRADLDDPTSFDISKLNPEDFRSEELSALRNNLTIWFQFVWFVQQTAELVRYTFEKGIEEHVFPKDILVSYNEKLEKQLGNYLTTEVERIAREWSDVLGQDFTPDKSLSPQTLLGISDNFNPFARPPILN